MRLAIPDDNIKDPSVVPQSKTLNLLLAANSNVYYYEGDSVNQIKNIGSKASDLRDVIISKKIKLSNYFGNDTSLVVLIKPTKDATYTNVINALNEMLINNVKTYVLMDASNKEVDKISH